MAALIVIARDAKGAGAWQSAGDEIDDGWVGVTASEDDDGLDDLALWVEIKKQVAILREGMEEKRASRARGSISSLD